MDAESLRSHLGGVLSNHDDVLDAATAKELRHFFDHDEYEYVVEGLALELRTLKRNRCDAIDELRELVSRLSDSDRSADEEQRSRRRLSSTMLHIASGRLLGLVAPRLAENYRGVAGSRGQGGVTTRCVSIVEERRRRDRGPATSRNGQNY